MVTTGTATTVNPLVVVGLVLPNASTCDAVIVWVPTPAVTPQLQLPAASTVAVHNTVLPSLTVTVAPGSPVPLTVGLAATVAPASGPVITGASATLSFMVFLLSVPVPVRLVWDAATATVPSGKLLALMVVL